MGPFPWLFRTTVTLVWPFYLVAIGVLIATAIHRRRHPQPSGQVSIRPLVVLLLAPLTLTVWASLTYGLERGIGPGDIGWASGVLTALALALLGATGYVMWRWRPGGWIGLPVTLAVVSSTVIAWFIGAMAIVDDWI